MQISRRVTNGLAWAGLLLVVGVPSADIISAQVMGEGASPRAAVVGKPMVIEPAAKPLDELPQQDVAEVKAAPVPADRPDRAQATTASTDPVDQYLQSGRELPSYISDGGETQTAAVPQDTQPGAIPATQAPATRPTGVETASVEDSVPATAAPATGDPIDPVEVASINPDESASRKVAPVPMPLAMRPAPVARPTQTQEPSMIIREARIIPDDGAADFPVIVRENEGFPVMPPAPIVGGDNIVSAEELEEWESGPLSEFLAERGGGEPGFDPDGFFLDEGPDSSATYRRRQLPPDVVYVFPLN
jgi:hypothetical protein